MNLAAISRERVSALLAAAGVVSKAAPTQSPPPPSSLRGSSSGSEAEYEKAEESDFEGQQAKRGMKKKGKSRSYKSGSKGRYCHFCGTVTICLIIALTRYRLIPRCGEEVPE
jgi:hypothetical protein